MRISFWPNAEQSWTDIVMSCSHAEATGWDGVWIADHFMPFHGDDTRPMLEAVSVMSALGVTVPRIRIGALVFGNTYRHPAVLANSIASADHIAGGRMVLGLGAGWQVNEHEAYGIDLGELGWRMDRFEEAAGIVRSLLREERTDHAGDHYRLTGAPMEPKTGAADRPVPLLIGGGGERRTLRVVARFADEWNVWGTPDVLAYKGAILDRHCADVGRDASEIERSAVFLLFLSDDEAANAALREAELPRPSLIGTPTELVDQLGAFADAGVDEVIVPDFNLPPVGAARFELMDRFATEVAASFR